MSRKILQIFILILASAVWAGAQSNSWNGLTPLRSTRTDVEKLLGPPVEKDCARECKYETAKDFIRVLYAARQCDAGWNVSKDTVISFGIEPVADAGKSFDELNLDRSKFSRSVDDASYGLWTNAEEGLTYYFAGGDKELISIGHIPKKSDNQSFRCSGFPPYTPEGAHFTMDSGLFYDSKRDKKEALYSIITRIKVLALQLMNAGKERYKAYVIVYFDNKMSFKEYQKLLSDVKEYWTKTMRNPPELIAFIEGGLREESLMEFYLLPNDYPPPAPDPTLPSPQFMRKQ